MRKRVYLLIISVVLLFVLFEIYNTSFIKVVVNNQQQNTGASYLFINQAGKTVANITSSQGAINKRLPRGKYEVEITQGDKSYLSVAQTRGFLASVTLKANLQQEKSRSFVGNNPAPCMSYVNSVLVSYACGSSYFGAKIHIPATANAPTYTIAVSGHLVNGDVEGGVNTKDGALVLVRSTSDEGVGSYTIYRVDSGFNPLGSTPLSKLSSSKTYRLAALANGFIIYDNSFSQAVYYASLSSAPQNIPLGKPEGKNLSATSIAFDPRSNKTSALYTSSGAGAKGSSEAIIGQGTNFQHYSFRHRYISADFCGTQICLLDSNKTLDVYSLSGSKAKLLFSLIGVQAIKNIGSSFLVVDQNGVINFDTASRTGYSEYRFGDYEFCGLQQDTASAYLLCVINNQGNRVALRIDESTVNKDSIDQKIEQLQKLPEIQNVSAYGQYIYVLPNIGPPTYALPGGGYGYNPTVQQTMASKINTDVAKIGIDTKTYTVINPYK
jgi:hypothetical protein